MNFKSIFGKRSKPKLVPYLLNPLEGVGYRAEYKYEIEGVPHLENVLFILLSAYGETVYLYALTKTPIGFGGRELYDIPDALHQNWHFISYFGIGIIARTVDENRVIEAIMNSNFERRKRFQKQRQDYVDKKNISHAP